MAARSASWDCFLGDGEWGPMAMAWRLQGKLGPEAELDAAFLDLVQNGLADELSALEQRRAPRWVLRPGAGAALGRLDPVNNGGDSEPGLVSARASAALRAYGYGFEAGLEPQLGLDWDTDLFEPGFLPREAWGAWRSQHLLVGFGMRERWLGPARRGALMLSDNARSAPMGTFAARGRLPGWLERLGRWRFETSWGWLQRPRDDVNHPGLMLMDLRWLPVPWIELGATRVGLFGGEGRPMPGFVELIFATEPHVYDDPDKDEPDQNEMASLDLRVTLPLARWVGGPVDWVEGWWQYGAEDIIARKLGNLPYPSLAGVANLWGLEAGAGPWVLGYEGSRVFDDYFRWYSSHRVYHEGFTQDGRVLGHHAGGDALSSWVRLGWYPLPWGADLAWEHVHRVGVVEQIQKNLLALSSDEHRRGVHARLWRATTQGGHWGLGYGVERYRNWDFTPGLDGWHHRVSVSWRGGSLEDSLAR